jgi:hypothetical protein
MNRETSIHSLTVDKTFRIQVEHVLQLHQLSLYPKSAKLTQRVQLEIHGPSILPLIRAADTLGY